MLRNLDKPQSECLLETYNNVWKSGTIPDAWNMAIVVPILKKGKPARNISSYHPISLTSTAGKLMEAMALARLNWIVSVGNVLGPEQSGFRRLHSTADSLADVITTLENAVLKGKAGYLILLDVKSAFDSLPHWAITQALPAIGVQKRLLKYLIAFLTTCSIHVCVGSILSSPYPVLTGVPQGSVISPFLFNLVLSKKCVPTSSRHFVKMAIYADDVALFATAPTRGGSSSLRELQ